MHTEIAKAFAYIRCNKIVSSKTAVFSGNEIERLSESIKKHGVLQPLFVRPIKYGMYEVVSGNKRLFAAKLNSITTLPCLITDFDDKSAAKINLILNSYNNSVSIFEKAENIRSLILDYNFTLTEISDILSCDIYDIINNLKLLHFSKQNRLKAEKSHLSFNQCVSLLKLENTLFSDTSIDEIINEKFNDLQTEEYVNKILRNLNNTVILKDIRIFTKTVTNAVEIMKNAGADIVFKEKENDNQFSYLIVISKNNNAIKSQ